MSSQLARDVREISDSSQVFEHHGWARKHVLFYLVPGSDLRTLAAMLFGAHPDEASPSNFPSSSFFSLSLREKGGAWGPRQSCHVVMSTLEMTLPNPNLRVRTLLAFLSGVLVLGSVW